MNSQPLLRVENLRVEFPTRRGTLVAVDGISFHIDEGEVLGVVGESGCGKSTLARALLALVKPSRGRVLWLGEDLNKLDDENLRKKRLDMQIVFQDPNSALNPKMNIQDSLEEGLVNRGLDTHRRKALVARTLDLVGISPTHSTRYPHEFSGGQKQRIVIARALCMEPDFLVLDEPVSNLDVSIQAQIINLLQDLKKELDLTYLFISHDLNLVAYLSDRIAVMFKGRLVETGSTDEIMNHPVHPYTLKLFSSIPGMNTTLTRDDAAVSQEKSTGSAKKTAVGVNACNYCDFCPMVGRECWEQEPQLETIEGSHKVACLKLTINN